MANMLERVELEVCFSNMNDNENQCFAFEKIWLRSKGLAFGKFLAPLA